MYSILYFNKKIMPANVLRIIRKLRKIEKNEKNKKSEKNEKNEKNKKKKKIRKTRNLYLKIIIENILLTKDEKWKNYFYCFIMSCQVEEHSPVEEHSFIFLPSNRLVNGRIAFIENDEKKVKSTHNRC